MSMVHIQPTLSILTVSETAPNTEHPQGVRERQLPEPGEETAAVKEQDSFITWMMRMSQLYQHRD